MRKALSWKPKLRGDIYCAPACGGNCKHSDFIKAHEGAEKLAKRLGGNWKPRVWENLGWWYEAVMGKSEVHPPTHGGKEYWASLYLGGKQFQERSTNPRAAVYGALEQAEIMKRNIEKDLEQKWED